MGQSSAAEFIFVDAPTTDAPDCSCEPGEFKFELELRTDELPDETSWQIEDGNGDILASESEYDYYGEQFTTFNYEYCLPVGCYDFVIDDSYGDGICCDEDGEGYFKGSIYGWKEVFNGGEFQFNATEHFCGEDVCNPWLVGPTTYSLNGNNNYFDGYLGVSNAIGSKANVNNVVVQLYDSNCVSKKDNMNSTNAVTIFATDTTQVQSFGYSVNISQSNIGDDTGGFIFPTGPSTGDVKFCTRVSTWEGSIEVAFRETNFILSFDLTKNTFDLKNIQIKQNNPDSFITDVDTAFSVLVYRCNNYAKVASPDPLKQDENLVVCLEPTHEGNMAHVVHISNFNLKIFAGSLGNGNYVEYNPVWFSTGGWDHDSLTSVSEQADPADVIMISTPVIAQFFIQGHTTISVSGNCFFEFDSAKEARAPVFVDYDMQFDVIDIVEVACLDALLKRIRTMF